MGFEPTTSRLTDEDSTTTPHCSRQNKIRTQTTNARPYIQAPHVYVLYEVVQHSSIELILSLGSVMILHVVSVKAANETA